MRRIIQEILKDPRNRVGIASVAALLILLIVIVALENFA